MNFKKILAGPFVWIFVAVMVLLIGSNMVNGNSIKTVDTAYGLKLIQLGQAKEVTVLGTDQRVDVVLDAPDPKYGDHIQFFYVAPRGVQVAEYIIQHIAGQFLHGPAGIAIEPALTHPEYTRVNRYGGTSADCPAGRPYTLEPIYKGRALICGTMRV